MSDCYVTAFEQMFYTVSAEQKRQRARRESAAMLVALQDFATRPAAAFAGAVCKLFVKML